MGEFKSSRRNTYRWSWWWWGRFWSWYLEWIRWWSRGIAKSRGRSPASCQSKGLTWVDFQWSQWNLYVPIRMLKLSKYLPLIVLIERINQALIEEAEVQTVRAPRISWLLLSIFDHIVHHLHGVCSLAHYLMMTVLRTLGIIRQDLLSDNAQLLIRGYLNVLRASASIIVGVLLRDCNCFALILDVWTAASITSGTQAWGRGTDSNAAGTHCRNNPLDFILIVAKHSLAHQFFLFTL